MTYSADQYEAALRRLKREDARETWSQAHSQQNLRAGRQFDVHSFKTFEDAVGAATAANREDGEGYWLPVDRGRSVWPRYAVYATPRVGDPISYAFNGDYRPDGYIRRISPTMKAITSTTGRRYFRRGENGGAWIHAGQWSMVAGHIDERNPNF